MMNLDQLLQHLSLLLFFSAPPCRASTWVDQQVSYKSGYENSSIIAIGGAGAKQTNDFEFILEYCFFILNIFF